MITIAGLDRLAQRIGGGRDPPVPSTPMEWVSRSGSLSEGWLHLRRSGIAWTQNGMSDPTTGPTLSGSLSAHSCTRMPQKLLKNNFPALFVEAEHKVPRHEVPRY
jgi:hypothetical protein